MCSTSISVVTRNPNDFVQMTNNSGSIPTTIRIKRSLWKKFKDYAINKGSNASALLIAYIIDCVDKDRISSDDVYPYSNDTPPSSKDKVESSLRLVPDSLPEMQSDAIDTAITEKLEELTNLKSEVKELLDKADSKMEALAKSPSVTTQTFTDAKSFEAIEPIQKLLEALCSKVNALDVEIEASYHQWDDDLNELEARWESRFAQLEAANQKLASDRNLTETPTEKPPQDTSVPVADVDNQTTLITDIKQGLNQNQLAKRLRIHPITVYRQAQNSSKFAIWTKKKDPDGIAWRRDDNNRYFPLGID